MGRKKIAVVISCQAGTVALAGRRPSHPTFSCPSSHISCPLLVVVSLSRAGNTARPRVDPSGLAVCCPLSSRSVCLSLTVHRNCLLHCKSIAFYAWGLAILVFVSCPERSHFAMLFSRPCFFSLCVVMSRCCD